MRHRHHAHSFTQRFKLLLILSGLLLASIIATSGSAQTEDHTLYLPLVADEHARQSVFGIEMSQLSTERGLDLVLTSGTEWVRRNGLVWKQVEPVEGAGYNWDAANLAVLEQDMVNASANDLNLILAVRGSPRWATLPYQADCAPVNPAKYEVFGNFLAAAVERYSQPPYNVVYWEIGNEPDAFIFEQDNVFGCWGVKTDPYYGGEAYGTMLKYVAARMKAVNPNIKVLNGGLLLDRPYDPTDPRSLSGRFFEGMLRAGAGDAFDIVSFHSYIFYQTPGLPPLGASVDWRVAYLKGLEQQYGVAPKPMIRTEAALLCVAVTPECRWSQADLVGRMFARTIRDDLLGTIWYVYDNDSYHNTALIEPGDVFVPRPAYFAYRHAATMLSGAEYIGPLEDVPASVEGYQFRQGRRTVIVFWEQENTTQTITIPVPIGVSATCTSRDGGQIACQQTGDVVSIATERSPRYVVLQP